MTTKELTIAEFVAQLKQLGFTAIPRGDRIPDNPGDEFMDSYDPPPSLQAAIYSLNIGYGRGEYSVSFQAQAEEGRNGEEMGMPCPLCKPDAELLDALRAGSEAFLQWFDRRLIATGTVRLEGEEERTDMLVTSDGKVHPLPKVVN
jgi:hypothetical protein